MKYLKFGESSELSVCGSYPQSEQLTPDGEAITLLVDRAKMTDFISCAYLVGDIIISERVKAAMIKLEISESKFASRPLQHLGQSYLNYSYYEIEYLDESLLIFEESIFELADDTWPNRNTQGKIEIRSIGELRQLDRRYQQEMKLAIWPRVVTIDASNGLPPIFSLPYFGGKYFTEELIASFEQLDITGYESGEPKLPRLEFIG